MRFDVEGRGDIEPGHIERRVKLQIADPAMEINTPIRNKRQNHRYRVRCLVVNVHLDIETSARIHGECPALAAVELAP